MSYQQPPGGYQQPQQGYQQPQQQGYAMQNYQQGGGGGGPSAPPAGVLQLAGLALLALGVLLAGVASMMTSSGGVKLGRIGGMLMSLGLVCAFFALIASMQKDKDIPNSVRVMLGIVAAIALLLIFGGMGSLFGGGRGM